MSEENAKKTISRRKAIKYLGFGVLAAAGAYSIAKAGVFDNLKQEAENGTLQPVTKRLDKGANLNISLLGFGCMRFPTVQNEEKKRVIDMDKSRELVDYAYSHGINYYDTAYIYHGGASEHAIGTLLKKYPRESFYLADKMPSWLIKSKERAVEIFQEQLDRCQVEYFDYYLLHSLGDRNAYDKVYEEMGVYDYLVEEKAKGRIKRLGFSFHGSLDFFKYVISKHDWDFVQIQLNYLDWEAQQAKELYQILEERNIPCIIMEPLRGGALAKLTPDAEVLLKEADPKATVASWAFRYAGSLPGVLTVLSGMTHMDHLVDNVKTYTNFKPLTAKEQKTLAAALAEFLKFEQIPCTKCRYCMPCPYGVDIPLVFSTYNKCVTESNMPDMKGPRDSKFNKKKRAFLNTYNTDVPDNAQAHRCIECGKCVPLCPQKINITGQMQSIKEMVVQLG